MPRWVYALLQGPLLASHLTSHLASKAPLSRRAPISALSADERTWLHALYRRLPAPDLCLAILPSLTGYPPDAKLGSASADAKLGIPSSGGENSGVTRRLVRLPLTWEALHSSGSRLFVLDAYAVAPECIGSHLSASDGHGVPLMAPECLGWHLMAPECLGWHLMAPECLGVPLMAGTLTSTSTASRDARRARPVQPVRRGAHWSSSRQANRACCGGTCSGCASNGCAPPASCAAAPAR